jgi:hypothetical protein
VESENMSGEDVLDRSTDEIETGGLDLGLSIDL